MKRAIWITLLAVLAFGAILVARLPASWVVPGPAAQIGCTDVDGTIWSGTCTGLIAQGQTIGDVTWELHPSRLLAARLAAALTLTRPAGTASGDIEIGRDRNLLGRNIHAELPLDAALMPQLPPNTRGHVHADIALIRISGSAIRTLQGRIELRNLEQGPAGSAEPLGSYSLDFPGAGGDPVGQLHDLGGPLAVEGALRLTPQPGFDLECLVSARPNAPAELARDIQYLGSPDAQGRRPFSLAATF